MVAGWGAHEKALEGTPIFAIALSTQYLRWDILESRVSSNAILKAVVQGLDYHWDKVTRSSIALLWRNEEDSRSACGWSGSVLCLGHTTGEAKPLLFQNFQEL